MAAAAEATKEREFHFTAKEFEFIVNIVYERAGIVLGDHKRDMVYTRLARRLRTLGLESFKQYIDFVKGPKGDDELGPLINAITTNHTKFFREAHHFSHFRNAVLKPFAKAFRQGKQQGLRVWSAGCSSGEEPYSLAMVIAASLPRREAEKVRILATDLDTNMLETAKRGVYPANSLADVPEAVKRRSVKFDSKNEFATMGDNLKSLITYKQLNLLKPWPHKGPLDVIFCRNVMIYFNPETRNSLIQRYASLLKTGGYLYLGHSESLLGQSELFEIEGSTTYKKLV